MVVSTRSTNRTAQNLLAETSVPQNGGIGVMNCHPCKHAHQVDWQCGQCNLAFCVPKLQLMYKLQKDLATEDWMCPRCFHICRCSQCRTFYDRNKISLPEDEDGDGDKDSRDEAFKQREDEVKEVGILRGELQQVREDHERQLQQVREDHERQLQQVREDHERQLQGLTSELARFKKYVGCIVAEVDKLIIKSCALEETCSPQRHQISVLEHQLKINLYRSMMEKEGIDGVQDIMKAYKAAHEEIDDSTDEHVPDGASSALINRVDTVQQKLEKDIDDMDAKIGDDWRVLDRDYDGQVTSASATASLKDAMAKDKATSEEENQKPTGESSSCVLDDDEEEEHSPLVFEAAESFYSVLDNEQEREQVDEDEEHEDEEDEEHDEDEQDEEYEDEEHEDEEPLPDVADETVGDVGKEKCHFDKGGMFDHKKELTLNKLIIEAHAPHQVLKVLSDAKRSSLSPLSPLNLETSLEFIAKKMDQISMTMSRRLAFARRRKMRVLVAMSMAALPQLSAKGISNLAWALSKIGGELLYLPEMDRVAEVGLTKVADFDSEDIATVALAFASMKHSAPRLFTELSKRASDIVSTFQPQELTEVLWAFAYLYEARAAEELLACLDQFTFDNNECLQRDWLVLEFNYSQLRNVCWSYAVLGQMNRTFFFHIWKILGHFQEQISEDKKILLVHQCLKFEYPYLSSLNKYIDETCIPAEEITRSDEYLSSSFHKKVRRFLAKTILDSTKEYFVDGYTLDPSLVDLKVLLAIVGPNHFSRNLGNALGYTVLLHRHYEATGWKVVTVTHEEWQGLKGTDKQRDYMREIIHGQGG